MKVLYDISVLGLGHIVPKARTGVFRVVENVARELVNNPVCEVKFCGDIDRQMVKNALTYRNETKTLPTVPFSIPPFLEQRINISRRKDDLIKQMVTKAPFSKVKRLQVKLKIKELLALERLSSFYNDDLIHPRDVRNADIYHSPFYALPKHIKKAKYKAAFLTCYDLIPILFPQYFEQGIINMMNNTLNSINPDTWVLCISRATRNDLLNHLGNKVNAEKVIVTELAASDTFYRSLDKDINKLIKRKHGIPDVPYILSLCTFEPRKNIDQVIKAFAKVISQESIKDLHLVLIGVKGWKFEKIFEELENSEVLRSKVIITGFVADEDLAALYSEAILFVYPSFYEGFGLPPLEAMQCGVPVITSNTSSLPEVVGDAGIMVSPNDLDELCEAMLSIYRNPSLREKMVGQSLNRASKFTWQRCGNETVSAYKTSLQS